MMYKLIAKNLRMTSGATGQPIEVELDPIWGGHTMKRVNFMLDIRQKSSTAAKAGIKLQHGPNGQKFIDHSTPISNTTLGAGIDLLSGDSDDTKVLGEVLRPVATVEGNGQQEFVLVDIYMVATPF